jgi:hypothetical protein
MTGGGGATWLKVEEELGWAGPDWAGWIEMPLGQRREIQREKENFLWESLGQKKTKLGRN